MSASMVGGERDELRMRHLPLRQSRRLALRSVPNTKGWSRALRPRSAFTMFASIPMDADHRITRVSLLAPGCLARQWDALSYRQLLSEWASGRQRRQRARTRRA